MQSAGNEKSANVPERPFTPFPDPPQTSNPFLSLVPVVGLESSGASQITAPFSSSGPTSGAGTSGAPQTTAPLWPSTPMPSPEVSSLRAAPLVRFNGPYTLPRSYPSQDANQQLQVPRFPTLSPLRAPSIVGPPILPPSSSFRPQPQIPSVPMGSPPQTANAMPSQAPSLSDSFFSVPRLTLQPPLQGYPNILSRGNICGQPQFPPPGPVLQPPFQASPAAQVLPSRSPFQAHRGGFVRQPPPVRAPLGFNSKEQAQFPSVGPPLGGTLQGLVEEFQSLSVGSAPGSHDPGVDRKSLPRPLDGAGEPTSVFESYPLNCHPRFLRLTTHAIPSSQSLLAKWHLPLGAVVHPLAEVPDGEEVPVVNFGSAGIVQCRRCLTYVNPYVTFTDSGQKWRCNLCSLLNDVPGEYFCALDASGRRCDIDRRPELSKGSVEFVAPTEYMIRPPMPPLYFFLIDVSVSAVRTGLLEVVAKTLKDCLNELSGHPRTQIGFLTFDSTLHFYSLKSSLRQPQMMVVADLDDMFLPLPDDLLVNLSDSRIVVDALLDSLPSMFSNNLNVESAFGPALKAAFMVMKQLGGKLLIFQSTLPSLGVGRLRLRGDHPCIYGTDKEHTLRVPEDPFYKQMAAEFTKHQIAVDIYACSNKYSDIASLGTLAKYTGGQVYHYAAFQSAIHQEKLRHELTRDLTRETAWEALMRIRCGKGVRFTTYHGHFMLSSIDLVALPAVDCDKAFAMQLSLEETLMTTHTYFQVALLYTSSSGERRIRVLTAAAPVVSDLGEMYCQADTGAIISLLSRLAIEKSLSNKLEDVRLLLQLKLVKSLKEYRNLYVVQHHLGGRLIYPESLKFLPLYILSLCKSVALRGGHGDAPLDERCAAGYGMMILPVRRMLKLLYPSFSRIDENLLQAKKDSEEISKELALTIESLDPRGLYIFDDGFNFILWFGKMLSFEVAYNVLGVELNTFPDLSKAALCERDNKASRKLMRILRRLREKDPSCYQLCHMVRQREEPREGSLLFSRLIEDQTAAGMMSYVDWILQIYRQTQSS